MSKRYRERIKLDQLVLPPLASGKKLYFAADFHLAHVPAKPMREREERIVAWLETIQPTAQALFLLGDIFDFWFEYTYLVPKGFIRFQHQLIRFVEQGIPVYVIPGNHDAWMKGYFEQEIGVSLLAGGTTVVMGEKRICMGHGDTWGASYLYRLTKKYVYESRLCQWLARQLPPDGLARVAFHLSNRSRGRFPAGREYAQEDRIFSFCENVIEPLCQHDYYILAHAHVPVIKPLGSHSLYCNVGDWIHHNHYAAVDNAGCQLLPFLR